MLALTVRRVVLGTSLPVLLALAPASGTAQVTGAVKKRPAVARPAVTSTTPTSPTATSPAATAQPVALPIPLASFAEGPSMMSQAAQNVALLNVKFTFLDKSYKNDVWTGPSWARVRVSCVRFKASSGFQFKVDVPKFKLTSSGLKVEQNISKIEADGLSAKFMLGPCMWSGYGIGVKLTDVKTTYTARPMVTFSSDGACTVHWNQDTDDTRISIGDLNILGVQNDIDKLAKDAAREAINAALDGFYGVMLRNELMKVSFGTCGGSSKKKSP